MKKYSRVGMISSASTLVTAAMLYFFLLPFRILNTSQAHPIWLSTIFICLITTTAILLVSLFVYHIIFLVNLNEVGRYEQNYNLRRSFTIEIIIIFVFSNISMVILGFFNFFRGFLGALIWGHNPPRFSGFLLVYILFLGELVIIRILRFVSATFILKWSQNLGGLLYDEKWANMKLILIKKCRSMQIAQLYGVFPLISLFSPFNFYIAMKNASQIIVKLNPHINAISRERPFQESP